MIAGDAPIQSAIEINSQQCLVWQPRGSVVRWLRPRVSSDAGWPRCAATAEPRVAFLSPVAFPR